MEGAIHIASDGQECTVQLSYGMDEKRIRQFKEQAPWLVLSHEYWDLLHFCQSLHFDNFYELRFDGSEVLTDDQIFPRGLVLMDDGNGNFWIMDVDSAGNPGKIFYWCHDPSVIMLQANSLKEFLVQIKEHIEKGKDSFFHRLNYEFTLNQWKSNERLLSRKQSRKLNDVEVSRFFERLPDKYVVADLREASPGDGVSLKGLDPDNHTARRYDHLHLWGIRPVESSGDPLSRLFHKFFGR